MRPRFSTHISRTCGGTENPRFLRKFQICGLITLLLDIGSLARGAKMPFTSPDFDQKMAKKRRKKGNFGDFPWGGSKRAIFGGVGYPPGGVKKGGFAYQIFIVFGQKGKFGQKGPFSGILAILGVFGGFGGFEGVRKVAKNGQNRGFLGFPGGSKKGSKLTFPRKSPITFWKKTGNLKKCQFL